MGRALIFDCDGVLADTERDGHLVAFNRLFSEVGLALQWSPAEYAGLLRIAGGKERLGSLFEDREWVAGNGLPTDPDDQATLVGAWHRRKTEMFQQLVGEGRLRGRPGVARLASEARDAGWRIGVASTAADEAVHAIVEHVFPEEIARGVRVFAGDIVDRKKPAPDIYLCALRSLGRMPEEVCVVEDSRQGLLASLGASCPTLITVSEFTSGEDFTGAALVVDTLGDQAHTARVLATVLPEPPRGIVTLDVVESVIGLAPRHGRSLPADRPVVDSGGES